MFFTEDTIFVIVDPVSLGNPFGAEFGAAGVGSMIGVLVVVPGSKAETGVRALGGSNAINSS